MSKMRIKFVRSYKSQNGNPVFVYEVNASESQIEQIREIQGEYYREDEKSGKPVYFTTRFAGHNAELIVTTNNNLVVDTSKFDAAASMAEQYGGNFGQALADQAAAQLLGSTGDAGSNTSAGTPEAQAPEAQAEAETEESNLDEA